MTQRPIGIDDYARSRQQWLVERTLEEFGIVLIAVLIIVSIAAASVHLVRWATAQDRADDLPPIFLAFDDPDQPPLAEQPSVIVRGSNGVSPNKAVPASAPPSPQIGTAVPAAAHEAATGPAAFVPKQPFVIHSPGLPVAGPTPLRVVRDSPAPAPPVVQGDLMSGETVRFRRPSDEPVQLLPGRLEVVSGDPRHREIRFVRVPGQPAELILGRAPSDSPQHVTLGSTTVSRKHARFAFLDGRWVVMNLSCTNPIAVNGTELSSNDASYGLSDGDRLELGEVVLCFHAQ